MLRPRYHATVGGAGIRWRVRNGALVPHTVDFGTGGWDLGGTFEGLFEQVYEQGDLMNRLTRAIGYGVASGLVAVVLVVFILGFYTNWANTQRPTFIREELAWFEVFSILSGLSESYRKRS
jgi:hypothetical protein